MTWFKVDDTFHSHPKVLAAQPAALGLWVVAGAWCSANPNDGFVPDYVLQRLLPGAAELAGQLVTCGLWRRAKGGYRFHDWADYQPTREEVSAAKDRKSSGGRLGNHRRWHVGKGVTDPRCPYCAAVDNPSVARGTDAVPTGGPIDIRSGSRPENGDPPKFARSRFQQANTDGGSDNRSHTDRSSESQPNPPDPTRPVLVGGPSRGVTTDRTRETSEPPSRCDQHRDTPDPPPCGRCGDARRLHETWQRDRAAQRADRDRTAPRCRTHPSELDDNCRLCRAERIAAPTGGYPIVPRPR